MSAGHSCALGSKRRSGSPFSRMGREGGLETGCEWRRISESRGIQVWQQKVSAIDIMDCMNNAYSWYSALIKPTWAPPSWLFGPVWTVLYVIIALTYGTVFYKVYTKELPAIVALPFALNLIFNFSFTYFQFGLKNNILASMDIVLILVTLIWALFALYTVSITNHIETGASSLAWIIYANISYLAWVSFATVLQLTITWMNE